MAKSLLLALNLLWLGCRASPTLVTFSTHLHPLEYYVQNMATDGKVSAFSYSSASSNSPANWESFAPECGGDAQSPINIPTKKAKQISRKYGHIRGDKWAENPTMIKITNNGHTVIFAFSYADDYPPTIMLNGDTYEFGQLHYHFGLNRRDGSEHHINGNGYAMEGHAVFINQRYGNLSQALNHPDGMAVIGRLYEENDQRSIDIDFDFLRYVRTPTTSFALNGTATEDLFSLEDIMGRLHFPYYMYHGSLTTPGCNEVVTWCVGSKALRISSDNLFQFRLLMGFEGLLAPNVRPIQKRNGRSIFYHKGG